VQRKLRVVGRGERTKRRRTRVGYRRIEIEGQLYVWNEEENRIIKKRNFERQPRKKNNRGRREGRGRRGGSEEQ